VDGGALEYHNTLMKLITTTQGLDPRPGLALSETVGLDLPTADPSLPNNWHALLPDLGRVRAVFEQHVDRLEEMTSLAAAGENLPLPYLDLNRTRLLAPIILPSKIIAVGSMNPGTVSFPRIAS
jgi:hypothetical protein